MNEGRILIVNDRPPILRALSSTLISAGYEVAETKHAEAALRMLHTEEYALLLLDITVPGMNSLKMCRTLRSASDIPIIMLASSSGKADTIRALDAGADDHVTKPFSSNEVLARIRAVLRRTLNVKSQRSPGIKFDGIDICFSTRKVVVRGKDVRLTPKEFDLLRYLVTNPNIPLAHRRILQAVWGSDYGEEVEYLRVFIKQLRKKLEPEPASPRYICTEHWLGYRFHLPHDEDVYASR